MEQNVPQYAILAEDTFSSALGKENLDDAGVRVQRRCAQKDPGYYQVRRTSCHNFIQD